MKNYNFDDTIASISTPIGKGGIGIVRISGDKAIEIADKVFLSKDKRKVKDFGSFTIHYGWIQDRRQKTEDRRQKAEDRKQRSEDRGQKTEDRRQKTENRRQRSEDRGQKTEDRRQKTENRKQKTPKRNQRFLTGQAEDRRQIVDEVLLSVMKSPKTYTTEDIIEINCHSGVVVLKQILDLILDHGIRLAKPGEFTKRAFVNGRIDLAQAEAVLDVVESKTRGAAELAIQQLDGKLSMVIDDYKKRLMEVYVKLEAAIDFPDEHETKLNFQKEKQKIIDISDEIREVVENAEKGQLFKEGRSLVICGKPNVGKSCLMNALLKKDRVIVTPIPGTTRDIIEESINIKGVPFRIIDTAGMISSNDIVEKEGVKRSKKHLESSDIVILVLDSNQQLDEKDKELIEVIKNKPHIIVLNKTDLEVITKIDDVRKNEGACERIVRVSALKSKGIDNLEKVIMDIVWQGEIDKKEDVLISNQRHKNILEKAYHELDRVKKMADDIDSIDLMSADVKSAIDYLGEITGETFTEDLLDEIFSQFCIGK